MTAEMVKLGYTLGLGSSSFRVGVQVPFSVNESKVCSSEVEQ